MPAKKADRARFPYKEEYNKQKLETLHHDTITSATMIKYREDKGRIKAQVLVMHKDFLLELKKCTAI